jgi:hypothetical protein
VNPARGDTGQLALSGFVIFDPRADNWFSLFLANYQNRPAAEYFREFFSND